VSDAAAVKLIAGGRVLQLADDAKALSAARITPATKVLVSSSGGTAQQSMAGAEAAQRSEEERLAHLERLRATVEQMASRGDGRGLSDRSEFSLENQVRGVRVAVGGLPQQRRSSEARPPGHRRC
jgi:hypothetical protein